MAGELKVKHTALCNFREIFKTIGHTIVKSTNQRFYVMQMNLSIAEEKKKGQKGDCDVHSSLNICWIKNSSHEQNEACEIVIDYEHERSVKGDSRGDREVQGDVSAPPLP